MNWHDEFDFDVDTILGNHPFYGFQLQHSAKFGGGGSSTKTVDPWSGTGMRELFKGYTDYLSPFVGGVSAYPGQLTPGPSPLQQTGFDVAQGLTPMATGGQQYFGDIYGQMDVGAPSRAMGTAESALADVMAPYDPEMAKQTLEPARQLALDTYFRDIVPGLKESYVSRAGTADAGALNRAFAREGSNLSLGLSNQLAQLLYSGSEAQKNRQQAGVGQAMQLAGLPGQVLGQAGQIGGMSTDALAQMLSMGTMQRGITQEQMYEPYQKWATEQPYNNPWTQVLATLGGSTPQMDTVVGQQAPSMASQLAPYAIAAALAMSDIRFKENFGRIVDALDKVKQLEGHTYNFKADERRVAGLIAQDVEKVLPEAVIEHHGVKFVDAYAVIALLVNAIKEINKKVEKLGA
jgi:hypothetical protein